MILCTHCMGDGYRMIRNATYGHSRALCVRCAGQGEMLDNSEMREAA